MTNAEHFISSAVRSRPAKYREPELPRPRRTTFGFVVFLLRRLFDARGPLGSPDTPTDTSHQAEPAETLSDACDGRTTNV